MIFSAIRIGLLELSRSTNLLMLGGLFKIRRVHGGRAFGSLILLCAAIIALIAFANSAGRGVLDNVTQVMLGHVKNAGTPIWVLSNFSRKNAGLDATTLTAFANGGGYDETDLAKDQSAVRGNDVINSLDFFPVVQIEMGDSFLQLPGQYEGLDISKIWHKKGQTGGNSTPLLGWTLDKTNPVWKAYSDQPTDWRTLVLNKKLFEQNFNYSAYRDTLQQLLPDPLFEALTLEIEKIDELKSLYLSIPFSASQRRLVKFSIIWAENLPGLQRISMLVPHEVMSLGRAVYGHADIKAAFKEDVDAHGQPFKLVTRLTFRKKRQRALLSQPATGPSLDDKIAEVKACLKHQENGSAPSKKLQKSKRSIKLALQTPASWPSVVKPCLMQAGFDIKREVQAGFTTFPDLLLDGRSVTLPCYALSASSRDKLGPSHCQDEEALHTYQPIDYYRSGLVFVPAKRNIADMLDAVQNFGDEDGKVFIIGESYLDALNRMDYTQKVIEYISVALGLLAFAVCIIVLLLQVKPLIESHSASYGLLLARGYRWYALYAALLTQLLTVLIIATVIAFAVLIGIHWGFETMFAQSTAAETARADFGLSNPRLIPQHDSADLFSFIINQLPSLLLASSIMGASLLIFSLATVYFLPLRSNTFPVSLIVRKHHDKLDTQPEAT